MIWLLLLSLVGTVVTGWLHHLGCLWGEEWLEELHGIIANTLMAAVGVHAAVVLLTDRLTRSDLVRAMVLGKKRVPANIKVEDPALDGWAADQSLLFTRSSAQKSMVTPFATLISGVVVCLNLSGVLMENVPRHDENRA